MPRNKRNSKRRARAKAHQACIEYKDRINGIRWIPLLSGPATIGYAEAMRAHSRMIPSAAYRNRPGVGRYSDRSYAPRTRFDTQAHEASINAEREAWENDLDRRRAEQLAAIGYDLRKLEKIAQRSYINNQLAVK
jgi:hypothetical protein